MTDRLAIFGYTFKDPALLDRALTHRSVGNWHNERLEFLGDAALNLVVATKLFSRFADATEGDLSRYRARLVSGATLAQVASDASLGDLIKLGPGELKSGGFRRRSILADTLEAVFGAIFLDGGLEAVRGVIEELLAERVQTLPPAEELKDPKTRLQEHLQGRQLGLPHYALVETTGSDHERHFSIRCSVSSLAVSTTGGGSSRRKAEQDAALKMLEQLLETP